MDESSIAGRRQHTSSRHLLPRAGSTQLPSKSTTHRYIFKHILSLIIISTIPGTVVEELV